MILTIDSMTFGGGKCSFTFAGVYSHADYSGHPQINRDIGYIGTSGWFPGINASLVWPNKNYKPTED